jgi:hypothetical protein
MHNSDNDDEFDGSRAKGANNNENSMDQLDMILQDLNRNYNNSGSNGDSMYNILNDDDDERSAMMIKRSHTSMIDENRDYAHLSNTMRTKTIEMKMDAHVGNGTKRHKLPPKGSDDLNV